jgi:putative 4-mercaptohistidine N1-methyltranferase
MSATALKGAALYESASMIGKYMLMHWGTDAQQHDRQVTQQIALPQVVHLPLECARLAVGHARSFGSALDLGCAVGRSTFELARRFSRVCGVDYSHEFIAAASALQECGELAYRHHISGDDYQECIASVDPAINRSRVCFEQGDACALAPEHAGYDAVLLANVLCRLPDPMACLNRLPQLVNPGGVLVMTTPLSWLEDYTPRSRWLRGLEDVEAALPDFTRELTSELPFLIREHRRKYEYIITQASIWRRN